MNKYIVKQIPVGLLRANCYVISNKNHALVIDPGSEFEKIWEYVQLQKLEVQAVLLTHGHFDHAGACKKFIEKGISVFICEKDESKLHTKANLSLMCGLPFDYFTTDNFFTEGKNVIGNFEFEVIFSPGHTSGSCCFLFEDILFTGDTILGESTGRTDMIDGSSTDMKQSLIKLKPYLNRAKYIYFGH